MNYKIKILSIISISFLIITLFFLSINTFNNKSKYKMATVIQFQQNIEEEATLIDVRTPGEFLEGHIEGAINIDFLNPNFVNEINKLDKNKEYAIYCRSGNRSSAAAKILKDNGFKEVVELSGGILSWEASGMNICYNC